MMRVPGISTPVILSTMPARPKSTNAPTDAEELSFEQSITELDGIIQSLDGDAQGLDQLVEKYERGMGLLARCQQQLEVAQLRIEQITRRADGAPETTPLSASATPPARPAAPLSSLPPDSQPDEIRLF